MRPREKLVRLVGSVKSFLYVKIIGAAGAFPDPAKTPPWALAGLHLVPWRAVRYPDCLAGPSTEMSRRSRTQ